MEYIEISAKTVDEAITEALVKLGTTTYRNGKKPKKVYWELLFLFSVKKKVKIAYI